MKETKKRNIRHYAAELRYLAKLQREDIEIRKNGMAWRESERWPGTVFWSHTSENDPFFPIIRTREDELQEARNLRPTWWQRLLMTYL